MLCPLHFTRKSDHKPILLEATQIRDAISNCYDPVELDAIGARIEQAHEDYQEAWRRYYLTPLARAWEGRYRLLSFYLNTRTVHVNFCA